MHAIILRELVEERKSCWIGCKGDSECFICLMTEEGKKMEKLAKGTLSPHKCVLILH